MLQLAIFACSDYTNKPFVANRYDYVFFFVGQVGFLFAKILFVFLKVELCIATTQNQR
jgi:hypothetical protein